MVRTRSGMSYGSELNSHQERIDRYLRERLNNVAETDETDDTDDTDHIDHTDHRTDHTPSFQRALMSKKEGDKFSDWIIEEKLAPLSAKGASPERLDDLKQLVKSTNVVTGKVIDRKVGRCDLCGEMRILSIAFTFENRGDHLKRVIRAGRHCGEHMDDMLKSLALFPVMRIRAREQMKKWKQEWNTGGQGLFYTLEDLKCQF